VYNIHNLVQEKNKKKKLPGMKANKGDILAFVSAIDMTRKVNQKMVLEQKITAGMNSARKSRGSAGNLNQKITAGMNSARKSRGSAGNLNQNVTAGINYNSARKSRGSAGK
jgi:hypothetical protein